jgi:hypothetical protein
MNLYLARYKNKEIELSSDTQYGAQLKAAAIFKAKKSYQVYTFLLALDGVPYVHTATN